MHRLKKYADIYIKSPDTPPLRIKKIFEFLECQFKANNGATSATNMSLNPSSKQYRVYFVYPQSHFDPTATGLDINEAHIIHSWIIYLSDNLEQTITKTQIPNLSYGYINVTLGYSKILIQIKHVLKLILSQIPALANDNTSIQKKETFTKNLHSLLQEHFQDPAFRTSQLAQLMNLSVSSVERYSVKYLQTLPRKLLLDFRLSHAHHLILNTNLPIRDIAKQTGFISSSYFSICFTDKYGTSPRHVRQLNKRMER